MKEYKEKVEYNKENNLSKPQLPAYVVEAIMEIAERLSRKPCFSGYSYREDMIGDGILACVKYIDSFNPEKSQNPFAYISQIIHNAFVNRLNVEQKQHYVKAVIVKKSGNLSEDEEFTNDSFYEVIDAFEAKMQRRRIKAAERTRMKEELEQQVD